MTGTIFFCSLFFLFFLQIYSKVTFLFFLFIVRDHSHFLFPFIFFPHSHFHFLPLFPSLALSLHPLSGQCVDGSGRCESGENTARQNASRSFDTGCQSGQKSVRGVGSMDERYVRHSLFYCIELNYFMSMQQLCASYLSLIRIAFCFFFY